LDHVTNTYYLNVSFWKVGTDTRDEGVLKLFSGTSTDEEEKRLCAPFLWPFPVRVVLG
jgi:hypothetical protein